LEKESLKIPFRRNAVRFHFAAPFFEIPEKLLFSYNLENYTDEWSDWSPDIYKDFTNLQEGEYSFRLKAKNIYGNESEMATYYFTILPPWHRSKLRLFYIHVIDLPVGSCRVQICKVPY
jgi:predicted phage tail protein